jgi:hypothetical protein
MFRNMKKVILAGFVFGCMSIVSLHAQKAESKSASLDSVNATGNPSTHRDARPIGKGSPIIQRQGATTPDSKSSEAAPAPAPASTEKTTTGKSATKPKSGNAPQQ